jgi:hypothetical protein
MKKLISILILLATINAYCLQSARINGAANTIPTTYGTGGGSLIASEVLNSSSHLQVINGTTEVIAMSFISGGIKTVPGTLVSENLQQLYVPASGGIASDGFYLPQGTKVYIRSDGSAASTGIFRLSVW